MRKKFWGLLGILIISLSFTNVYAREIVNAGDNIIQEGVYDSNRLVAGNIVDNKAYVDGLSLVFGNQITLEGSSTYGVYAGNNVIIEEKVEKDMFVAGNSITIASNAIIGRDAYIAGNSVIINADIARDLRYAGSSINLSGITVNGDAYIYAEEIILDANTIIVGKLTYSEDSNITGLDVASIGSVEVKEYEDINIEFNIYDSVWSFIISVVSSFIVMITLFYLMPNVKEKLNKVELKADSIIKMMLLGLILLIIIPIVSLIALFTGILTPLALIVLSIYAISIYLSSLLVYYIVGNIISNKVFKKDNVYLALICGIILVKLIKLIPFIGGIVGTIVLFYGMGLIYKFIYKKGK